MPIYGRFRRFFFLSCRAKNRKITEKRCQKWCLFMGCVSGILARIISPDSKKCSWLSNSRKQKYFVAVCFSSLAGRKKPMSLSTPLPDGTCRASGGLLAGVDFGDRFKMEKGMFQCTLLEYPLINYFALFFMLVFSLLNILSEQD